MAADLREMSFQRVLDDILKPAGVKVGGYPEEIFVDLAEEERESWQCNICYLVVHDPRECVNKHAFCSTCIFAWSMTYGANSDKCPMCRVKQPTYQENKEIDKQLGDKRVRCPEESCTFVSPLRFFLHHSHGRARFCNDGIDLESLRRSRPAPQGPSGLPPLGVIFFPNPPGGARSVGGGATGQRLVNVRDQIQQSRILLHNMLMVLQLEMQMRRSALSSLPANADHSTRLQRMDEVLALNEQLDEAAMMLAMLMSLPVREAMNLAQARSNMLGGIISPSSLPTTPSISAPSSVPSLPPTPLSSSGSSQVSGTSSTSQTRASVQQRGRFRFDPVSESEDESDSDSSDSSFLTPTIRRRPSHSDAPAERVLSVNGAGHSPISQSSPRGTSQTTGSLPLPLTSPREGGLATTTELGRARRRSEIRDDLARTMESSNTSTAESVQLPRISAQSNSIQSSSVNRTMGPSSVYRNALSEFRNEGSEQRTSTASSTQTSPRSVSNSNATEALRDSLISQRRLQRGQGVPNRLTMDNRSPNTDAQDVDLHTSPNLNSQLSNSSNPRNDSQLNRERSVIRPSARNTSGQASNIMASSTTVPRTSYAPQRRFRREVADGQSPRSTENWSSNDDSSTAVVTQSSQPIIRVSHSDQPNITARYRRQSQQANSSQSTSHHAGTGEHRTTQQEPSNNNTISNSSMAARRASEQPSSSTPNSSLTARRQSKPNTSVEARRISNRSSAGQATTSEPSSSSSRDNANASTNKKKPASTPKKKSSPNNVNSSGPTNTRGPSTPGQLMRARRRSEIFQQITMNTTPDDT